MSSLVHTLSHLVLGQKGGENRILIIELLKQRPYNINQLAECLQLNYRTIKHHIDVLRENDLLATAGSEGYGEVYFLSPELEQNYHIFNEIASKHIANKLKSQVPSNAFFQNIIEQTRDTVMIIDEDGLIMFWNKSAEKLLGYSDKEVLGKAISIFNDPDFFKNTVIEVAKKKVAKLHDIIGKDKAGKQIDMEIIIDGIADEEGKIIAYSILARDITVRKWNEERLRYLNVLLTKINDINQMINKVSNVNTLIQNATDWLNDAGMFNDVSIGLQRDPKSNNIILVGHCGMRRFDSWRISLDGKGEGPDCIKLVANTMKTTIVNGSGEGCLDCQYACEEKGYQSLIIPMKYQDKLIGLFNVSFKPGHIIYPEEIGLLEEIVRDITLARIRLLADNPLAEKEDKFSSSLFVTRSGAWDWNLKTGVLSWSNSLEQIFGFGLDEGKFTHDALLDRVHVEDRNKVANSLDACLKGKKPYNVEYRIVWPDGSTHWIREIGDVLMDDNHEPTHMLVVVGDITKRKVLENELLKAVSKSLPHKSKPKKSK